MSTLEQALLRARDRRMSGESTALETVDAAGEASTQTAADDLRRPQAKVGVQAQFTAEPGDVMNMAWTLEGSATLPSQLRRLRREINEQLNLGTGNNAASVVAVSSALPGDGKTFIALALARIMAADRRRRVVLVDGDLIKRHVTRMFRLDHERGLSDCVSGRTKLEEVLHHTQFDGLEILPAGQWTPEAADDLSSARFDALLAELRRAGPDCVFVLDTAPILAAGETVYAVSRIDYTVIVVRADHTPRGAVVETLRKLGAGTRYGLLLNGQHLTKITDYYGYSESYGQEPSA